MAEEKTLTELEQFKIDRIKKLKKMYADEPASKRLRDETPNYAAGSYTTAKQVRQGLEKGITNRDSIVQASQKLYTVNPIYKSIIDYLANMYSWQYKVIPHKVYSKSKAKLHKQLADDDYQLIYNLMLEAVDGLNIESKFPSLLSLLFVNGAVYLTTACDEESITVDSLLLPDKYCRKVAETQYGTAIIQFDFSYFQDLGLREDELNEYFKMFPKEFKSGYGKYLKDTVNARWQTLDPHFSTGVLLNDMSLPTMFYVYGGILDYEKYQDNELERNENQLKYIVAQKMPIYQDKLVLEVDEVEAIHKSLKKIVDTNDKARLITTYGELEVLKIAENDTAENQVLSKAFKAIFNNAGFNSSIFTSESVEALKMSLIRDKGFVWRYVQQLISFYSIAINNWFDFKIYEADIDILPISPYTYNDDIEVYRNNATLGVGKLDYLIASGIKQKNIQDQLGLESFLELNLLTPMQTSYTQTAEDRDKEDAGDKDPNETPTKTNEDTSTPEVKDSNSGIEPTDKENSNSSEEIDSSN